MIRNLSITRRALTVMVCGATAFAATACGSDDSGSAGSDDTVKIAFVMGALADPFFKAMKVGAEEAAAENDVELIWQGEPSEYSPATQIPIVDQVLAQSPDGLVLIPTDPDALQPSVAKATGSGIPVVSVDTRVTDLSDVTSFITGDNADGGAKAADAIAEAIDYTDGESYQVVVGLTSATATTNVARLEGFESQIDAEYPGIEIVDQAYSQSKPETANTNVNNWLTKYPDLDGIFAIDGTNATGAASALQAKDLVGDIALVGYDAYPDNVQLLKDGVFTALIAQDPGAEARLAIENLVQVIRDGSSDGIEAEVVIPNVVLTADTSDDDFTTYTYVS